MKNAAILLVVLALISLFSGTALGQGVFYLDESGAPYGYRTADVYDIESALNALATPPTVEQAGRVLTSAIPPGTRLEDFFIQDDTAIVVFSREVTVGLTEARLADIFEQVKNTLRLFGVEHSIRMLSEGKVLSDYLPRASTPVGPNLAGPVEPLLGVNSLGTKKITVSPGHGKRWNGSSWATARPVYCAPLNQEDYHNLEMCQYLETYLLQDGATVKMVRCTDKNYGASPWAGGEQWWRMGASYWLQHLGYPCSVYGPAGCNLGEGGSDDTNEIQSRPLSSDYDGSDIYVSLHTNGSSGDCFGTGCPTGTCTYYDAGTEHAAWGAVSQALATNVNNAIINTIRTQYPDPAWYNRGVLNSNGAYGEIRIPDRAAILIELAFHDSCDTDAVKLRDNFFRSTCMWAVYKGICDYFGVTPTWDYYSCELVSHDIPATMEVGEYYTVHVTMRNRGVLWTEAKQFRLGAVGDSDPCTNVTRQTISGEVGPNTTYTFTFTLRAPLSPGTYVTDWRMVRDGFGWFGPTVSQTIQVTGIPDTQAPSVPTGLNATAVNEMRVDLTWNPSIDDREVSGYKIYRNNVQIGTSATTSYSDNTCQPDTTYTYEVSAYDAFFNESGRSLPAQVTTPQPSPPTTPQNLRGTGATTSTISLAWDPSTDNIGVVGYRIYRNGVQVGTSSTTSYTDTGLNYSTSYTYEVDAYDGVPSYSGKSAPVVLSTTTPPYYTWTRTTSNGDCYIRSGSPTATGDNVGIQTGWSSTTSIAARRGLVQWDMTGAPSQAAIVDSPNSVRVKLYCYLRSSNTYRNVELRKVNTNWNEATATWATMAEAYSGVFAVTSVGPVGDYTWSWNGRTLGLPEQNRGVQVYNQAETESSMAKIFNDMENYGAVGIYPRIEVDYYDIVAPTNCSISINGGAAYTTSTSVTLTLSASDFPSGMSQMRFSNDGTNWSEPEPYATTKSGWELSPGDGLKTVYVKYKDISGNWSTPVSDTIVLDTTPPTGTIEINGGAIYASASPVTLTISSDGAVQMRFSNEDGIWSGWETYATTKSWPLSSGDGAKTVYAEFKDAAGNVSTDLISDDITLDTSAPSAPTVTDEGAYTPSTDELIASWSGASDAESGMEQYRYAIGTSAGGTDVVGWTTTNDTAITRTGLSLTTGQTYYFSVQAQNGAGLWSTSGVSDGIMVVADTGTIAAAKALDNAGDKYVALLNKYVTARFTDYLYIQEPAGGPFSGIRVAKSGYAGGDWVSVAGVMGITSEGERVILSPTVKDGTAGSAPHAVLISNRSVGGEALNAYTPGFQGVPGLQGLNNVGLLITIAGRLTKTESGYWFVNDGQELLLDPGNAGIPVDVSMLSVAKRAEMTSGDYVIVTGICQAGTIGSLGVPVVKPRQDSDIIYYR